jgi:hypothetical protein
VVGATVAKVLRKDITFINGKVQILLLQDNYLLYKCTCFENERTKPLAELSLTLRTVVGWSERQRTPTMALKLA